MKFMLSAMVVILGSVGPIVVMGQSLSHSYNGPPYFMGLFFFAIVIGKTLQITKMMREN